MSWHILAAARRAEVFKRCYRSQERDAPSWRERDGRGHFDGGLLVGDVMHDLPRKQAVALILSSSIDPDLHNPETRSGRAAARPIKPVLRLPATQG